MVSAPGGRGAEVCRRRTIVALVEISSNLKCRHCGDRVPEERADAGYDYCLKPDCVEACIRPLNVVAVAVNKSNDQLALREQLTSLGSSVALAPTVVSTASPIVPHARSPRCSPTVSE